MNKTILLIVVVALIILYIYNAYFRKCDQEANKAPENDKCENVVYDPVTLERIPIVSERGDELFKYKLMFYLNRYLENTRDDWNYILPSEFNKMDKSNVFILDTRKPSDYKAGHIKGSTNIFWLDLMKPENLQKIPKDKQIIVVCYVGHTASQVLVLLKLLGYDAKVLKFGMGKSPTTGVPVAGWINYGYEVTK